MHQIRTKRLRVEAWLFEASRASTCTACTLGAHLTYTPPVHTRYLTADYSSSSKELAVNTLRQEEEEVRTRLPVPFRSRVYIDCRWRYYPYTCTHLHVYRASWQQPESLMPTAVQADTCACIHACVQTDANSERLACVFSMPAQVERKKRFCLARRRRRDRKQRTKKKSRNNRRSPRR